MPLFAFQVQFVPAIRDNPRGILLGIGSKLQDLIYYRIAGPRAARSFELERAVAQRENMIHASEESPVRFDFVGNSSQPRRPPFVLRAIPHMAGSIRGIRESLTSLQDNPTDPKTIAPRGFLNALEAFARRLGISSIGYAKVPRKLIFRGKAVARENAIVLTMEMDWQRMERAPHPQTAVMVLETYNKLGRVSNRIADYLREHGYSAHAGHPLMGLVLYLPLARSAGLGWHGLHGLLITPEHGPRVRLAAVFTSIDDLPFAGDNAHTWIADFCRRCCHCVRACPADAILEEPVAHESGQLTYILNERCFPIFQNQHRCSVCIKVCPFNRLGYGKLKELFEDEGSPVEQLALSGDWAQA